MVRQNHFLQSFLSFYKQAETDITSIAVAYYMLISIFPLLLIVANILPYFHIKADTLLQILQDNLPDTLYQTVAKIVKSVLTQPSSGLLSFSILSALWSFSQSLSFLQKAFNKAYGVGKDRSLIWNRLFGLIVSFGLQILFALSLLLTMFSRTLLTLLHNFWDFDDSFYQQLSTMTQPTIYLVLFLSLVMLYFFLPNVKIHKLRYVLPGTAFVLVVIFSLMHLFSVYIDNYMNHFIDARFLGSVVTVVIMVWFIIISKILIIGAILNASYQSCHEDQFETRSGQIISLVKKGKGKN